MATRYKDFGSALLAYRDRPEGEPEPVKTNWTTIPANDNADPEETIDYGFERSLRITPSVAEIMEQAKHRPERNKAGHVVRIGKLRFSDGAQTERAYTFGPDGCVIQYDCPMPAGAMLGCREKAEGQLGGKGYTSMQLERSNDYFAEVLGTIAPRYVKRTKRRNGRSITVEESRAELARAIANTPTMPPVTRYAPGLPCGTKRIADCFVGMQKGKKGESGAIAWEDIASAKVQREVWEETLALLKDEHKSALDNAMVAGTFADVSPGGSERGARKRGRKLLAEANDNLANLLKKSAA